MSDPPPEFEADTMTDLVAFEVEGSGHYLVPLSALARYEIQIATTTESFTPVGWGWSLPVVRWNTFHTSQIDTEIALAPDVVARLAAHHFVPAPEPPSTTSRQGRTAP